MSASWYAFANRLPLLSKASVARHLVRRGNALRDAGAWLAAAALYEEALALAPARRRIHIQCGHMFKEAGAFDQAEAHYLAAERAFPDDADLALQLGHFYKTAGRSDEAIAAYHRALALDPHVAEAVEELSRLGGHDGPGDRPDMGIVVAELLPASAPAAAQPRRDAIVVRQLGRELGLEGDGRRVLRGIEAIRGWCLSTAPLAAIELLIDDRPTAQLRFSVHPLVAPAAPGQAKYVFNHWHDFSTVPDGERHVALRFRDAAGQIRTHHAAVRVQPQTETPARLASDAYIPTPIRPESNPDAHVAALPSMVRPVPRGILAVTPRSVLVQRVDQLGDLVCSVPALRRLRALLPDARLIGLVTPANADLAHALGLFDALEVVALREEPGSGRLTLSTSGQQELRGRLAAHRFDLAIDLGEGDASRPLLRLSGAPFLYGFRPRDFRWLSAGLELDAHDPLNRAEASPHSRKPLALVEGLAALLDGDARGLARDPPDAATLEAYGLASAPSYAVLHTGARLAFSRWPGFARLTELLLDHTDLSILLMREADEPAEALPLSNRLHVVTGRLPFTDFDALLAGAAVFVGNDSGPKHLASLRGTPVVSIHCARVNWNEWGQETTGVIVSRRVPCAGCGISSHPEECGRDIACLRLIQPEEVLDAVLAELAGGD